MKLRTLLYYKLTTHIHIHTRGGINGESTQKQYEHGKYPCERRKTSELDIKPLNRSIHTHTRAQKPSGTVVVVGRGIVKVGLVMSAHVRRMLARVHVC